MNDGYELWAWYRGSEWEAPVIHRFWFKHLDAAQHAQRTMPSKYFRFEIKQF